MIWKTHRYPVVRHRPVNTTVAHPVTSPHPVIQGQVAVHLGSNSQDMMGMSYKHDECIQDMRYKSFIVICMAEHAVLYKKYLLCFSSLYHTNTQIDITNNIQNKERAVGFIVLNLLLTVTCANIVQISSSHKMYIIL